MTKNKNLLRYGLGGVTIAAILVALFLAFGNGSGGQPNGSAASTGVDALQTENASLRQAVSEMQEREAEYRRQIEAANMTIEQLSGSSDLSASAVPQFVAPTGEQGEFNTTRPAPGFFSFLGEDHERSEHSRGFEHSEG